MNILILSMEPEAYSQNRFAEETKKKGHTVAIVNPIELFAYISSKKDADMLFSSKQGESNRRVKATCDAIIPRIAGEKIFEFGCMVVQQFNENLDVFSTATEFGMRLCSNKFKNAQFLSRYGIRVPKQILAHRPENYSELIEMAGGLPSVGKLQRGSQGDGVFWMNDELAAVTSLKSFEKTGHDVIIQNFIDTGKPANDIRIIVIGAETEAPKVFAYKRFATSKDFRSNYSISHEGEKVEITEEERNMAIIAAKLINMPVTGVDIMRDAKDNNKPYIIEMNSSPGLAGIEKVTGENVAGEIVNYIIDNFRNGGRNQTMYNKFVSKMDKIEFKPGVKTFSVEEALKEHDREQTLKKIREEFLDFVGEIGLGVSGTQKERLMYRNIISTINAALQ